MIKLFKENSGKKLLSGSHLKYCFLLSLMVLFLGAFFGFQAFGKTYHNITFSFNSFENLKVDEIAQIKVSKSGGEYQTITGGKFNVKSDESIKFKVFLKEGFEASRSESQMPSLIACFNSNISDQSGILGTYKPEENCFEWDMGTVLESKFVKIYGSEVKKLNAAQPKVMTSSGEEIDFNSLGNVWDPSFEYNTKYTFEFSSKNDQDTYEIKSVKAKTAFKESYEDISCESTEIENGKYQITLYDPSTEFGGICEDISNIEILVENIYHTESIAYALDDGNTGCTLKFICVDADGNQINLTKDMINIKLDGDDRETMFISDGNETSFAQITGCAPGYVTIKAKAVTDYNKSNFTLWDNNVEIPKASTSKDNEGFYTFGVNLQVDKVITIKNLNINQHTVEFNSVSDETNGEKLSEDSVEIFAYSGSQDNIPESPFNSDDSLATDFSRVEWDSDSDNFSHKVDFGKSLVYYIKENVKYNQKGFSVIEKDDQTIIADEKNGFKRYTVTVTEDKNFTISGLFLNTYTIVFKKPSEELDGTLLSQCLSVKNLNDNENASSNSDGSLKINISHGENVIFELSPGEDYILSSANLTLEGLAFSGLKRSDNKITFQIQDVSSNGKITISGIEYKICNITFQGEDGQMIPQEKAILQNSQETPINNTGTTVRSGEKFSFSVRAGEGYNISSLEVLETSGKYTFNSNDNKYESSTPIKEDIIIKLTGIKRIHFNIHAEALNGIENLASITYKSYDESGNQTGESKELPWDAESNLSVAYGSNFEFSLEVKDEKFSLKGIQESIGDFVGISGANTSPTVISPTDEKSATIALKNIKTESQDKAEVDLTITIKKLNYAMRPLGFEILKINENEQQNDLLKKQITMYMLDDINDKINLQDDNLVVDGGKIEILPSKDNYLVADIPKSIDSQNIQCFLKNTDTDESKSISKEDVSGKSVLKNDTAYNGKIEVFKIPSGYVSSLYPEDFDSSTTSEAKVKAFVDGLRVSSYEVEFGKGFFENDSANVEAFVDSDFIEITDKKINIEHGKSLKLKVTAPGELYFTPSVENDITIKDSSGNNVEMVVLSTSEKSFEILINNVVSDLKISLTFGKSVLFVKFPQIDGVEFYKLNSNNNQAESKISGTISIQNSDEYKFAVKASKGYDLSTCKLKVGEEDLIGSLKDDMMIFELKNINSDVEITGQISKSKCAIKLEKQATLQGKNGASSGNTTVKYYKNDEEITEEIMLVEYGGSTEFKVVLEDKCSNSSLKVIYKKQSDDSSANEINSVSGMYKLIDVTEDLVVKVENLSWNEYVLNFVKNDFANFVGTEDNILDGTQTVLYGDDYKFKVSPKEGYSFGTQTVVNAVSSSGDSKSLSVDVSGNYVLPNVTEGYTISIENIGNVSYYLNFIPTEGVTYYNDQGTVISGKITVSYGQNFEFSIGIEDAYSDSLSGMYISLNEGKSDMKVQKLASGRYLLQNIMGDVRVKACNISKNKYVVNLKKDEGIEYYTISNKLCTGENDVEHGEDFYFRVKLYSAYADSKIRVMMGTQELSPSSENIYKIESVKESKTITVVGIEKTDVALVIETINQLPGTASDSSDIERIIEATRKYNALDEYKKSKVKNYSILENLQKSIAQYNHVYNGISVEGLDWYIKVIANPIISDMDACTRIYGKLSSEYILDLYDVYLWDVVNDQRYTLPEGKSVVVHLPTPDISYFENPTGIHENDDGKLDYLTLNMSGGVTSLETSSFSPIGIVANRSLQPGRSSLIDAADANISAITDYTLNSLSGNSSDSNEGNNYSVTSNNQNDSDDEYLESDSSDDTQNEKFVDNSRTTLGSALKLILIIMIIGIIAAIVFVFISKRKNKSDKK